MKKLLLAISLLIAGSSAKAASPSETNNVGLRWTVMLDNTTFGGMSTNDFLTNFTFQVRQSTSASTVSTNWLVLTNVPIPLSAVAPNWTTNWFLTDNATKFYVGQVKNYNGGVGPFSTVGVAIPTEPSGMIQIQQQ